MKFSGFIIRISVRCGVKIMVRIRVRTIVRNIVRIRVSIRLVLYRFSMDPLYFTTGRNLLAERTAD